MSYTGGKENDHLFFSPDCSLNKMWPLKKQNCLKIQLPPAPGILPLMCDITVC
jgi:hypothetical protein